MWKRVVEKRDVFWLIAMGPNRPTSELEGLHGHIFVIYFHIFTQEFWPQDSQWGYEKLFLLLLRIFLFIYDTKNLITPMTLNDLRIYIFLSMPLFHHIFSSKCVWKWKICSHTILKKSHLECICKVINTKSTEMNDFFVKVKVFSLLLANMFALPLWQLPD